MDCSACHCVAHDPSTLREAVNTSDVDVGMYFYIPVLQGAHSRTLCTQFAGNAALWFRLEVSGDRESQSPVKAVVSDGSGRRRSASVADGLAPASRCVGFPIGPA